MNIPLSISLLVLGLVVCSNAVSDQDHPTESRPYGSSESNSPPYGSPESSPPPYEPSRLHTASHEQSPPQHQGYDEWDDDMDDTHMGYEDVDLSPRGRMPHGGPADEAQDTIDRESQVMPERAPVNNEETSYKKLLSTAGRLVKNDAGRVSNLVKNESTRRAKELKEQANQIYHSRAEPLLAKSYHGIRNAYHTVKDKELRRGIAGKLTESGRNALLKAADRLDKNKSNGAPVQHERGEHQDSHGQNGFMKDDYGHDPVEDYEYGQNGFIKDDHRNNPVEDYEHRSNRLTKEDYDEDLDRHHQSRQNL